MNRRFGAPRFGELISGIDRGHIARFGLWQHYTSMRNATTTRMLPALLATLAAMACQPYPEHPEAKTDFVVADAALAAEVRSAAEAWARAGLVVADYVTINQHDDGVPVRTVPRRELGEKCNLSREDREAFERDPSIVDGCVAWSGDTFEGMWLPDDLSAERRAVVLGHELIHILVPEAEHIANDVPAIFSVNGTSTHVTVVDMEHLAGYTAVTVIVR